MEKFSESMEITQRDRDLLRQSQQKMNPGIIGNIVEHKIQDPVKYKTRSRQEEGLSGSVSPNLPKLHYKSIYYGDNLNQKDKSLDVKVDPTKNQMMPSIDETDERHENLPITRNDVQTNLWLNMDRFEFDKLEWMSNQVDKKYQNKLKSVVHFDSDGKPVHTLLAENSKPDNHKEPPKQQAHDIGSLINLLDSAYQPQITYALNVISKIASRATVGLYDAVFDENIHQVLIKECLLRVRHHLDSPNETICQSALKCLRSLICNTQVDEIFLDKLAPIKSGECDETMWLGPEPDNFEIDMKDIDCVHSDAILGLLVRTDILNRLKYLLDIKTDPESCHTYHDCILDILIRVARYSPDICWILFTSNIYKLVVDRLLPLDIILRTQNEQSYALRSLKFLRILAQAAYEFKQMNSSNEGPAIRLPSSIVSIISNYYYIHIYEDDTIKTSDLVFRIHIETLRLMRNLSMLDEFAAHIFSTLNLNQAHLSQNVRALANLSVLKNIESPTSINWQYAASLIGMLGNMMNHERFNTPSSFLRSLWTAYVRPQTMQWVNDIIREKIIPHQDASIAIYTAVNLFEQCRDEKAIADLYGLILEHSQKVQDPRSNASLIYFKHLVREATCDSQLNSLLKSNGRLRDPVMLPSYGFMNFNSSNKYDYHLNSIISTRSPYILLNLYLLVLQRVNTTRLQDLRRYYIDNLDLVRYIRSTSACYYKYPLDFESKVQKSVLAQLEVQIIASSNLLLSRHYLQSSGESDCPSAEEMSDNIAKTQSECYSQLLLNVISIIGLINPRINHMASIKDELLEKVVLNESFHSKLTIETFVPQSKDSKFPALKFNELNRQRYDGEFSGTYQMDYTDFLSLKTVYLSCEQPGRFWVFQPLIEYYLSQIHDCDESKKDKECRWFLKNINGNKNGKLPANCSDIDIISLLLRLHASLMHRSPSYFQLAVKQNIEEYLCLIGTVFLDDNLFLDGKMNRALWHNLEIILNEGLKYDIDRIFCDASKKISTLELPLVDFFNRLVDQYEAASYNDTVFTNFLLLFMTPKCDKIFKKKLFSDKVETCISQMRIAQSEVWIPTELITRDKESDPEVRSLIKRSAPYITRSTFLDYYRRYHSS